MSKAFARNLKFYRNELNMTQTDLANAAGVTRGVVNNYERAASEPSFAVVCKFAEILGVEIADLVSTDEPRMMENPTMQLVSEEERALLNLYRNVDNQLIQTVVLEILRAHQKPYYKEGVEQ